MEEIDEQMPMQLFYDDPKKAPLSSSRIVTIKPTTANFINNCSSSDTIQFKLPNSGILKTSSMYMSYDLKVNSTDGGSGGITTVGACLDEHSPDAIFSRHKVFSSDGTQVTDINNYSSYCSVMNRLNNNKDESSSRGSIVSGSGLTFGDGLDNSLVNQNKFNQTHASDGGDAVAANELNNRFQEGYKRNYTLLSQQQTGGQSNTHNGGVVGLCHRIQGGLLDSKSDLYLPCFAMGSGYQLEMQLEDSNNILRCVGSNAVNKLGAVDAVNNASTVTYDISNIQLTFELVFYSSTIFSSISEMLCDGIKFRHPRIKTQVNSVNSQSNTVNLNEHGRSVNKLIGGLRLTANTGSALKTQNDFLYTPSGSSKINQFQCQIGSESIPSQPIKYGCNSYLELERAVSEGSADYRIGNKIDGNTYYKNVSKGEKFSGDALFGVSFMSHGDHPELMSGKASSSGSIPLSLQLDMTSTPSGVELFTIIESDQITEILHDGSVLVSR